MRWYFEHRQSGWLDLARLVIWLLLLWMHLQDRKWIMRLRKYLREEAVVCNGQIMEQLEAYCKLSKEYTKLLREPIIDCPACNQKSKRVLQCVECQHEKCVEKCFAPGDDVCCACRSNTEVDSYAQPPKARHGKAIEAVDSDEAID
jgi:hypothetical protein